MGVLRVGHPWNLPMKAQQAEVLAARRAAAEAGCPEVANTSVAAFYAGRSVLLTGGTGFLGRLVMELVLRSCPDVEKIYVLMRPKRGVAVQDRLRTALADPLFERLRAERPGTLEAKVHAVAGDVAEPRLGLSEEDAALLCREVSVFFSVAASVNFVEPIKKATLTNLRSAQEAVALAKAMPKLKAMIHVSTAYCNTQQPVLEERAYPAEHDWRTIIRAAEQLPDPETLTFLGPKLYGPQPNSYTFTKGLAEQVINEASSEIPVVIVRPSIVVGTDKDPIPGWIDNLYGFSVFWVLFGKGVVRIHETDPTVSNNLIPGDVVAKTVVLAAWTKGLGVQLSLSNGYSGVEVVHSVAPENVEFTHEEMHDLSTKDVMRDVAPMPDAVRYPCYAVVSSKFLYTLVHLVQHVAFGALVDLLAVLTGQKPRLLGIYRKYVIGVASVQPFQGRQFFFKGANQWRLQSLLPPSDVKDLCYLNYLDVRDSRESLVEYSGNVIRGVVKYCLRVEYNPDKAKAHIQRLWWIETMISVVLSLTFLWSAWTMLT